MEKRSPTGDVWRYVWAGAVLLHTLKNGTLVETYVHEPGGRCPLARLDTDLHYIVPDAIGAPSEELAPDGSLTWLAQKGTWGEGFSRTGPTGGEPFLGQWADAESGLSYNFFRYYDPDLGRYLSPDPIDLLGGLNLYVGVTDPFRELDRWGLCTGKTPKPGQPPEYGPFVHHLNKGGESEIVQQQQMIAREARPNAGGESAVRAYTTPFENLAPRLHSPVIEFYTTSPPSGSNPGQSSVQWLMADGDRLNIRVSRIAHPDGSVTLFL